MHRLPAGIAVTAGIPVVVLAGFLGAGKTTVLNHLLRRSGDRRFGVLVNDFGSVNIDALLVSGRSAGTVELSSGCICCTTDADGLSEALGTLAASGVDAIVVEASGIAEPKALIRMVLAARDARIAYGGLVYVVDAANLPGTLERHPAVREHLAVADLVLCNKADLAGAAGTAAAVALVREVNATAPVLAVTRGAVDPGLFADPAGRVGEDVARQLTLGDLEEALAGDDPAARDVHSHDCRSHDGDAHGHLHDGFESVALQTPEAADPRRLAQLLERPPAGVYRIKGLARIDLPGHRGRAYEVHAVGGFVQVATRRWPGEPATELVLIGAGMDASLRAPRSRTCAGPPTRTM